MRPGTEPSPDPLEALFIYLFIIFYSFPPVIFFFHGHLYVMELGTGSPILRDDRNARLLAQILVSLIGCSGQDASKFSCQGFV